MEKLKDESDRGYVFTSTLAKELTHLKEEAMIFAAVVDSICLVRSNYERSVHRSEVSIRDQEVFIIFDTIRSLRLLPACIFGYESRTRMSYVNTKKKIEALGFDIEEVAHAHGTRLVWKINTKKAA